MRFSDLFISRSKDLIFNSGYSLQAEEITDATTDVGNIGNIGSNVEDSGDRATIPDITAARRRIRGQFRGAA